MGCVPDVDYRVRGSRGVTRGRAWLAFPAWATDLCNEWVMVRRRVPAVPKFEGRALPLDASMNDNAMHMSIYFRPWVLDARAASTHAPMVTALCIAGAGDEKQNPDLCPNLVLTLTLT